MTSVECAPWRLAWAERENQRRQRAYRDATDAWQRRNDHLGRLRVEAASFLGCTQPRTGLPVDLDADELVFRVVPSAKLVEAEARHLPGLPAPGPCDFAPTSDEALPAGLRVVDTGMAVVTSHRVAFAGSERRREWTYADLVGAAHHPDVPVTLLPDHGRLFGLLVPANAVVNFRFYLALAAASAAGDRAEVATQLDALLAAHQDARPTPMPVAEPDEAPLTAVRPDRRALGAAAVATMVFATLGPGALGTGAMAPQALGLEQAGPAAVAEAVLVPVLPVGPVAPKARAGSVSRAMPTRPSAPSPARQVVLVARPVAVPVVAAPDPLAVPPAAPAAPVSSMPNPGPVPTTDPPRPGLPTPSTTSASPTPTGTPPSDARLLTVCLDPLQLPLLDQLLCPSPAP
ncbi:hypothetical protein JOD64_003900 [Micromonospora luteifusca]|uniref:Uncharacterized protein n=1 Tax=Micromonospora luteifusca TaxID=709860 RepID=A0ABS2LWW2_9ACTN|nr:hypothetical protein [Micromonospora luteifusca]MBM7492678.1 hypothetical protein [Micromonospora luteifusca]